MTGFDYIGCRSTAEACEALRRDGAQVIAGGTDLLITLRRPGTTAPRLVVDISRIDELCRITVEEATGDAATADPVRKSSRWKTTVVRLGATSTHAGIAGSAAVREAAPLLAAASCGVGSPQIRNRGTVGGNIMNAATCADTVPPLIALGAAITLCSTKETRTIPLAELFEAPYRTRAKPGELLSAVTFSALPPGSGSAFLKLGRRNALSIARLSVAVVLVTDSEGRIADARIVPGAAVPVWRRFSGAEEVLRGERPAPGLFAEAGHQASAEMVAVTGRRWSTEYKEPVLGVLVQRALASAASSIRSGEGV